jgi:signal recognition particle receptor subunit beta
VTPTIGYKVEKLTLKSFDFTVYDMSGMDTHRDLWETQYKTVDVGLSQQAIIFVVDAADEMRYKMAAYEFEQVISHPDIRNKNIPILVFLNKVDIKGSCSPQECTEFMNLHEIKNKPWSVE